MNSASDPRSPRLPADYPVQYRPRGTERASLALGQMVDISESGLRLQIGGSLPVETVVELEIAAGGNLIHARGQVMRVVDDGDGHFDLGLRWLGIATENLYALLYPS
jgi:hypothetical protein